ncbi:hypothetical protein PIB30_035614 [Stylosanthes scabra]|uniref:Uncharacterized protein n=1 Tax=Stylosanthes scabra TaxID=79078 RepID=A0ABU6YDI0_9FABA|nr:hypothetical protein [Stylosanthes scabra]
MAVVVITIHLLLPTSITSTLELRLMHRLWLRKAHHFLDVSMLILRYGPLKMNDETYVSQRVNGGIFGINFPTSGNNKLSDVTALKKRQCHEIAAHDDLMETPNYE